jgi:hypothetical protein
MGSRNRGRDGIERTVRVLVKRRRLLLGVGLLCVALAFTGCASRRSPGRDATQSIVRLWRTEAANGRAAGLSEIGFGADGAFTHSGNNALGLPVNFGGRYEVGRSAKDSVIRLTYDDFPDKPTTWFFRLDGDTLTVAPSAADLGTEVAIVFRRAQQQ